MSLTALSEETPKGESPKPDDGEQPNPGLEGTENPNNDDESQTLSELLLESEPAKKKDGESQELSPDSKRFVDLAEKLETKPEDLYALEVALSDGTPISIGAMKDIAQKATDYETAQLELETKRQGQEAENTRVRGELNELIRSLPKAALNTEAFRRATERYDSSLEAAKKATTEAVTEWRDPAVMETERADLAKHLEKWGFEPDYLESILDPRSMIFIRDAWKLSARVEAAMAKIRKRGPDKSQNRSANTGKPAHGSNKTTVVAPLMQGYDSLLK